MAMEQEQEQRSPPWWHKNSGHHSPSHVESYIRPTYNPRVEIMLNVCSGRYSLCTNDITYAHPGEANR